MPDSDLADDTALTSAFYNTYIREQVVATCTSGTRPTGVEGRLAYETDNDRLIIYNGSTWRSFGSGAWVSYTPSWTNLTVGNGTVSAQYSYVPLGFRVQGELVFGSTTSISGTVTQTIPNSVSHSATGFSGGSCVILDAGTQLYAGSTIVVASATVMNFVHGESGNSGLVNATSPMTWTTSDRLRWDVIVAL